MQIGCLDSCHEAKKKSIIAVRQRKNRLSPWVKEKNRLLPWGEEKSIISVRWRKNRLSPWGEEKSIIPVRRRKNRLSPWGDEKIDYCCEAWLLPWGKEKIDYRCEAKKKSILPWGEEKKIRCCWEFISNTEAPLKRRAKAETVSLRAIIYRNFSELWETEGVVKKSLSDIIKGTDRPIPPSTEDWKYSKDDTHSLPAESIISGLHPKQGYCSSGTK